MPLINSHVSFSFCVDKNSKNFSVKKEYIDN